ncbi:hypothetical protein OUZ56_033069 [Daphnia magna]|uniref:Uncharacterized protein n=1 Tax=Daphnia magna TaxID=35525 RepID=A0ABQ9ZXD7_9CRUS|nr:hypothetical protein OUZ56_033069 [Daphnia magna]
MACVRFCTASALAADKVGIWIKFERWWIKTIITEEPISLRFTVRFTFTFNHQLKLPLLLNTCIQLLLSICKGLPIPFHNPQHKCKSCVFLCICELDRIPSFLP